MTFPESEEFAHFMVLRSGGFDGNITVTYQILPGTNASSVDYFLLDDPTIFVDTSFSFVQSKLLILYDNNVWERPKVIRIGLVVDPPSALGTDQFDIPEMDVWITDDGDGGEIQIPQVSGVAEARLSDEGLMNWTNRTCAIWAERTKASSGQSNLWVEKVSCAKYLPVIREEAINRKDYFQIQATEPTVWKDGEHDRRCIVGLLSQEVVQELVFGDLNADGPTYTIWVNPDGKMERDEGICFKATMDENSSASLSTSYFALMLEDSGVDGAGRVRCSRGLNCSLNLDNTSFLPAQYGFVQSAEFEQCIPCEELNDVLANDTGTADGLLRAELGMSLKLFAPGDYSVCQCFAGTRQVASMVLSGPRLRNSGFCVMSAEKCAMDLSFVEVVEPEIGNDHLRILTSCSQPELTSEAFVMGAHAKLTATGFEMEDANSMRRGDNGMYELCWCRETATRRCKRPDEFMASAGIFVYVGPNRQPSRTTLLGHPLVVDGVFGTGLHENDRAMLLLVCGEAHPTSQVNVSFDANRSAFSFPALRKEDGFLALTYHLCWCQGKVQEFGESGQCNGPEDFRADMGLVRVVCPDREVDLSGDGHCKLCPLMIQQAGGKDGMQCVISGDRFFWASFWFVMLTLFFLLLCGSLRCSIRARSLNGMPRKIEDITKMRGKLVITTTGLHNFMTMSDRPIPVTLWGTGHYLLDSRPGKLIHLYVIPSSNITMEVVQESGEPVEFNADSSMGSIQVSFFRTLLHTTFPKIKFPLICQLLLLILGTIAPRFFLEPGLVEMAFMASTSLCLALLFLVLWKLVIRSRTTLNLKLQTYEHIRREDGHRKTKEVMRGPSRGIRVWKILDLYEHFQALIRDRNMYYLDPNIIRPLTASVRLSFSELVGPDQVEWFVSHWWGTPVAVYCDALKRHASEVKAKETSSRPINSMARGQSQLDAKDSKDSSWENTTYWICTFSNNQYKIREELGEVHTESSFYLALHSEGLRGTCMLLDEMAMPLKRSWCLFELLQTIELEEKAQMEAFLRAFSGLLFCTSNGVLNYGSSTVEMSMMIGERLLGLSLRDAEATTEKDKKMIADLVQESRGSFDEIDLVLRVHIRDALKACQKQVNFDFGSLFERLPRDEKAEDRADTNLRAAIAEDEGTTLVL
ncbi:Uncharacterized protein SCF082_LOCUS50656 [Durusdinium trenchii]|uniref:Uncharacterized protein n=1 Tax=Durusdinium trenchii TaxID=1381693 RepID=A0ABP0S9F7_9DINO